VGTQSVTSPEQAVKAIHDVTGKFGDKGEHSLALRILRNGQMAFVALNMTQGSAGPG
jgi:hypothetical protein